MSLIANKFSSKKMILLVALLITLVGGTSTFALGSTSTATLKLPAAQANGSNINIWEGYANVSTTNNSKAGGRLIAGIKKSVAILPDPTVWQKTYSSNGSYGPVRVSIPDASTYYASASAYAVGSAGTVKVVSLD